MADHIDLKTTAPDERSDPRVFWTPTRVQAPRRGRRWTLVLDLDETIIANCERHDRHIVIRPFALHLLKRFKSEHYRPEIILWTNGSREHMESAVAALETAAGCKCFDYIIYRADSSERFEKNLTLLKWRGFDLGHPMFIVDDNPHANHPSNGLAFIKVPDYHCACSNSSAHRDVALRDVGDILDAWAKSNIVPRKHIRAKTPRSITYVTTDTARLEPGVEYNGTTHYIPILNMVAYSV